MKDPKTGGCDIVDQWSFKYSPCCEICVAHLTGEKTQKKKEESLDSWTGWFYVSQIQGVKKQPYTWCLIFSFLPVIHFSNIQVYKDNTYQKSKQSPGSFLSDVLRMAPWKVLGARLNCVSGKGSGVRAGGGCMAANA